MTTTHPELIESKDGVLLAVHVQPGAGASEVVGRHGGAIKVRVGAPPAGGRANDALRALLAKEFDLEVDAVVVVTGETSRAKRVRLGDLALEEADKHLDRLLAAEAPGKRHRR